MAVSGLSPADAGCILCSQAEEPRWGPPVTSVGANLWVLRTRGEHYALLLGDGSTAAAFLSRESTAGPGDPAGGVFFPLGLQGFGVIEVQLMSDILGMNSVQPGNLVGVNIMRRPPPSG